MYLYLLQLLRRWWKSHIVWYLPTQYKMFLKFVVKFFELQLIVDSATGLFRVDFCGRGELSERQVADFSSKLETIILMSV